MKINKSDNLRKDYWVEMPRGDKFLQIEKTIAQFLLGKSNILKLRRTIWREGFLFKKKGDDNDPLFVPIRENLKGDFIKKELNNSAEMYVYRLSQRLKRLLSEEGIFFYYTGIPNKFYGLEDPEFYKNGKRIGYVISHETIACLHLTHKEKKELGKKGITFAGTE